MRTLSDATVQHLRSLGDAPVLAGTRYELLSELGRGGMGTVYCVRDRILGREVALKVLGETTMAPDARERLTREAYALARLEHPGIVPVYDAGVLPDGRAYYAMKLVRGERLDYRMERSLSIGEALRLFARICDAIAFAHANGIIHRDLKPQNVMLGAFGEVLVLDWGLAKLRDFTGGRLPAGDATAGDRKSMRVGSRVAWDEDGYLSTVELPSTLDGAVCGTPGYMAPEQAEGAIHRIDERTDVYALGGILRALGAALEATIPKPLTAIATRALSPDPSGRYPSVVTLAADVARLQDGLPVSAYREAMFERAARLLRRHKTAVGLVLAYLLMRIVVLVITRR
jgi:serine/threonine protein kinase